MSATQHTIREITGELYTIISVDEMEATPALKQDQIRRGFEGRIYTMSRVIEGTRKRPAQTLAIRTKRGEFQTLF